MTGTEQNASLARSYVYGNYIDEVLTFRDHDQNEFMDDLFLHGDDMRTVYSVTNESRPVAERSLSRPPSSSPHSDPRSALRVARVVHERRDAGGGGRGDGVGVPLVDRQLVAGDALLHGGQGVVDGLGDVSR